MWIEESRIPSVAQKGERACRQFSRGHNASPREVTDKMHGLLMVRADALTGCVEGSPEEAELAALTDVIESYERRRWGLEKCPAVRGSFPPCYAPRRIIPFFGD